MELSVINIKGKETGKKVTLSDEIFAIEPNDHAIYLDVKQFLANQRQGTHKSKQRNEVSGSTKKIKKQKGTGGARAGSIKNPQFIGGGRIFGPQPRDYRFKLNKKVKSLAKKSAFAYKVKDKNLSVIENFQIASPKTKEFVGILAGLGTVEKKSLFIIPEMNDNVVLSSRNIQRTKVITVNQLTTFDLLNAEKLYVAEGSVAKIEELLK